jgi:membrane-associated phospholipid phosphatase
MLGIGGVLGAFLAIHSLFGGNIYLIIALIFCAGCVGFARINENEHNLKQVYCGFLIGAITEFLIFLF